MTIEDKVLEIAKFCEIDAHKLSFFKDPNYVRVILGKQEDFDWDSVNDFDPNRDWNWLHKAWEKFRNLHLDSKAYSDHRQNIAHQISYKTISEAFEALYEGINWYTNLSNPSHH